MRPTPPIGEDTAAGRTTLVCGVLLFGAAVALYLPALDCGWVNLDDYQYVRTNPYVLHPSAENLWAFAREWDRPSTVAGYYQPLTMYSYVVDRLIDGAERPDPRPIVFHATNVLLHAICVLLLFAWLRSVSGSLAGAAVAAVLFAVHPMQVESVVWIAQRKTLLATAFSFALLLLYHQRIRAGRRGIGLAIPLLHLAAMLSKPTAFAMPLFLLLLDLWPQRRWSRAALIEKWPLYLLSIAAGAVAFVSQQQTAGAQLPGDAMSPLRTLLVVCHNIVFYPRQLLLPFALCPQYPTPAADAIRLSNVPFALGVAGTVALVALLVWRRRSAPLWVAAAGFYLLMNPVVLGGVRFQDSLAGDRFVYLPLVALLLPLAIGVAWLLRHRPERRLLAFGIAVLIAAALAFKTAAQQSVWRDSLAYWDAVVAQYPADALVRYHRGNALLGRDDYAAAAAEFQRAIALEPGMGRGHLGLGEALVYLGRPADAVAELERGLALAPDHPAGNFAMGLARSRLGDFERAADHYRRALVESPVWPEARFNLGNCLSQMGQIADAEREYARALRLDPGNADVKYSLGMCRLQLGQVASAAVLLREAATQKPEQAMFHYGLAVAAASAGDVTSAWSALSDAVRRDTALLRFAEREPSFDALRKDARWAALAAGASRGPASR